jgi:hypothetical protein
VGEEKVVKCMREQEECGGNDAWFGKKWKNKEAKRRPRATTVELFTVVCFFLILFLMSRISRYLKLSFCGCVS